jgi:hypothetical protein
MRVSLKVLGILWVGLFLIIGILLFNAYSKLKPNTFIALIRQQVQKNYPGSILEVGKISYRFSLDFNLNLQGIQLRRNGKLLAKVGEVELKVPWWLLLANHGNAQINLTDMDIYIDHRAADLAQPVKAAKKQEVIRLDLPKYLVDANFTLRAKHISIRDESNSRNYFVVSKLLVREFQYGKNSAFEMNIPISIKHKQTQYTSDLWLFGDVTPEASQWKLNYRGEFRTRESSDKFQIEDLNIGGTAVFSPSILEVESDLSFDIEKQQVGSGKFSADQEGLLFNLALKRLPLTYFGFIYEEIKNPYLVNPSGEASGKIKLERSFENSLIKLNGDLEFSGKFVLSEMDFIPGQWKVRFDDSLWIVSFISPKGEASFFRRSIFDHKVGKVIQYSEELGFTGLDLSITVATLKSLPDFISEKYDRYFSTAISFKKCLLGDQVIDGDFRFGFSPDQKFFQGFLGSGPKFLNLAYSDKNSHSVSLNFNSFKWHQSFKFLHPLFTASTGTIDGKIEGRWDDSWESGQWLALVNSSGLSGLDGKMIDFLSQTSEVMGLKSSLSSKLNLHLSAKNNLISINQFKFGDKIPVNISGTLRAKQKSFLTLSYPNDRKLQIIKKEISEPYWQKKEEK